MRQIECLLRFIRASREGNFRLHLASAEELIKYLFAHDIYKYARLTPYHVAEMYKLETEDPATWLALNSRDMSVCKSNIPFCGIGVDHALEQEIRNFKGVGGVTGITQNDDALTQYLLTAPEISRMIKEYWRKDGSNEKKTQVHYQFYGAAASRLRQNVQKMKGGILSHAGNLFGEEFCSSAVALVAVLEVVDVRGVLLMRVVPHAGEVREGPQSPALQAIHLAFLLLKDDDPTITALADLGVSLDSPPCQDIQNLERFACAVYCKVLKSESLKELRWELFCRGKEGEKLPLTHAHIEKII
eukprot:gene16886-8363_t